MPLSPLLRSASSSRALHRLPYEILLRVFSLCNGDDLRTLSEVDHRFRSVCNDSHLWKTLYQRRTGHVPKDNTCSYRDQYDQHDRLILSITNDCEVTHNHPPYWDKLEDRRSLFGRAMILHAVSWLHVSGWLRGVHAGRYRVVWRLFILPHAANIFDIDFRAETSTGCSLALTILTLHFRHL
ncbi:hypothetical protein COEREDRAFT_95683 [Coemansia reversa NRRL 1564]|uniref:F-box domain-containing protein n=1 Tax=Coemansia reversa (strain ATCC 12441 / NRRL 1564) TaxID=763665 RepID=A0A2G5BIV6_COERN|nr:hypothetical protein COEREDRAFT_95683 [Coemansia reversa NRRL 1564]|eukprot:PIA18948.1 hypothetical protein COEREDRAFT_95683 [Coemansia reversa NRRL 1564]